MIDLHCHMLPGVDDGARDDAVALAMARIAAADGIRVLACTPHVYPGLYENDTRGIRECVAELQRRIDDAGIALRLTIGADAHLTPQLLDRVRGGSVPTLHGSRYLLLEPPHHVAPPRFAEAVFAFVAAGYVPVITHPERLSWIESGYRVFESIAASGAWLQVTAGSLTGRFGGNARYWAERLLDDGRVQILATDAHGVEQRAPLLDEGRIAAEKWVGADEAMRLVVERPQAILDNREPHGVARPCDGVRSKSRGRGVWARLAGRRVRL